VRGVREDEESWEEEEQEEDEGVVGRPWSCSQGVRLVVYSGCLEYCRIILDV
jgi:hypothetical protein